MTIHNKILSILLAIALVLSAGVFPAERAEAAGISSDQIDFLYALGIIDESSESGFNSSAGVTRADYVTMLMKIVLEETPAVPTAYYDDVSPQHPAFSYISAATALGMVRGRAERIFAPDEPVALEEAVKMLLYIAGYEQRAIHSGGYPSGYLSVAAQLGILSDVSVGSGENLTKGEAASLIYNALFVEIMQQITFGETTHIEMVSGGTMLEEYFDVTEDRGIVEANAETSIDGGSLPEENEVVIDDQRYRVGITNAREMLGYQVRYFWRLDEEDRRVLVHLSARGNDVLTIAADDLEAYQGGVYEYFTEDAIHTKTVYLSNQAEIVYNGANATEEVTDAQMKPDSGSVTLIDNNMDGQYDVALVTSYTVCTVIQKDSTNFLIFDKYDATKKFELDVEAEDRSVRITDKEGFDVAFGEIAEWNIAMVAESLDKSVLHAIIVSDSVSGEVNAVVKDANGMLETVTIAETMYEVNPCNASYLANLRPGDKGIFYFDHENRLAAYDVRSNQDLYGYVIGLSHDGVFEDNVQIKVFTSEGKMEIKDFRTKVKLNNETVEEEMLYDALGGDGFVPCLVKMVVNSEGEISSIETAKQYASLADEPEFGLRQDYSAPSALYRANIRTFDGKACIDSDTVVFSVPVDLSQEEDFSLKSYSYFGTDRSYNITTYSNSKTFGAADVLVLTTSVTGEALYGETAVTLVEQVSQAVTADGEETYSIKGYQSGSPVSVVLANADVLDQNEYILKTDESGNLLGNRLKPGDIIRYATDRAGYATELEFVFDSEKLAINGNNPTSTNFRENKNYMYASIYSRVGNEMKVTVKDVETEEIQRSDLTLVVTDRTNVIYRWDPVRQRFQKITSSDLIDYVSSHTDYSKAFIQLHVGEPRTIVVYE